MFDFRYSRAPVRLLALFVLLAGMPLAALGWLGWRLLHKIALWSASVFGSTWQTMPVCWLTNQLVRWRGGRIC